MPRIYQAIFFDENMFTRVSHDGEFEYPMLVARSEKIIEKRVINGGFLVDIDDLPKFRTLDYISSESPLNSAWDSCGAVKKYPRILNATKR